MYLFSFSDWQTVCLVVHLSKEEKVSYTHISRSYYKKLKYMFMYYSCSSDSSDQVSDFVHTCRGDDIPLKKPAGAMLKIGPLEDTIYRGNQDEVYGWGHFYLPTAVNMTVVGVVSGTSCPSDQVVLMTCENQKMYAYDGEELHLVASDLQQLCDEGMNYPAPKSYYKGESFKNMVRSYSQ